MKLSSHCRFRRVAGSQGGAYWHRELFGALTKQSRDSELAWLWNSDVNTNKAGSNTVKSIALETRGPEGLAQRDRLAHSVPCEVVGNTHVSSFGRCNFVEEPERWRED